jgi:hypothetical protein
MTLFSGKNNPEKYTYKLIDSMVKSGHGGSVMVGSDISNNDMWKNISTASGYGGFFTKLKSRIQEGNNSSNNFIDIMGGNVIRFLSG